MSSKAYSIVKLFEKEVSSWAGSRYGVAVESCCSAIFLSLLYIRKSFDKSPNVIIPKFTYPGVACSIIHAGFNLVFEDIEWSGIYKLTPFDLYDCALRFKEDMFKGKFCCLSFHYKKLLPIGRGGMILTNDKDAYEWLKMARFDGRKEIELKKDNAEFCGWNMYMTPEQSARGLALFESMKHKKLDDLEVKDQNYPDLSKWKCFIKKGE